MPEFRENNTIQCDLSKKIYLLILLFSFIWLIMIFLAPLFLKIGGGFEKVSSFIYIFFSKVCHQEDERSFQVFEHNLGVCSRCVWIYAGFFLGSVLYPLKYKLNKVQTPSIWILVIPVLMLMVDVLLNSFEIILNSFFTRSVTGFVIGFVLPFFIIPGFVRFFYEVNTFIRNKVST